MSYYIARTCSRPFDSVLADVDERLKGMGFCVLADIDVQATLKKKIGGEIPQYRVLVACNPRLAHEGLQLENKLGVLALCNVIVREAAKGQVEVACVDPITPLESTENAGLAVNAREVRRRLLNVLTAGSPSVRTPLAVSTQGHAS